jgi:hypothetical protein
MSLRSVHLLFVFLAIVGADLFGVWSFWRYVLTGETWLLVWGVVTVLGGLGLIFYAVRFVRKMDAAGIH